MTSLFEAAANGLYLHIYLISGGSMHFEEFRSMLSIVGGEQLKQVIDKNTSISLFHKRSPTKRVCLCLVGQDIAPAVILRDCVVFLSHRVVAQILIASHEPTRIFFCRLALLPGEQIASLRVTTIAA